MEKLSKNFTLFELLSSPTAHRQKIFEQFTPSENVKDNLLALVTNVLQPLRDYLGKPIVVTSGYRCPRVNSAVGGARTSQHIKGQAADIKVPGMSTLDVCKAVKAAGIEFDQMIEEYGSWVHISFNKRGNRNQIFQKASGKPYTALTI
ncbi:MAG: D-Ala-D-Ala carboxypeptidase family metallohydrolase [Cytophagales bacterium]|nr:D-Ala-D-Ala carboxypeptidase family metallohydrolase [Cytophagales bacterium]